MPHPQNPHPCADAHKRVAEAAAEVDEKERQHEEATREVRHGNRNIRMLLAGVLRRLERTDESRD